MAGFVDTRGLYDSRVFGSGKVVGIHTYATGDAYTVTVRVFGAFSPPGEAQFLVFIS